MSFSNLYAAISSMEHKKRIYTELLIWCMLFDMTFSYETSNIEHILGNSNHFYSFEITHCTFITHKETTNSHELCYQAVRHL